VLILLPTDGNKLLMYWKRPFNIKEKFRLNDYIINIKGKRRPYHANMKKYFERVALTVSITVRAMMIPDSISAGIIDHDEETEECRDKLLDLYNGETADRNKQRCHSG